MGFFFFLKSELLYLIKNMFLLLFLGYVFCEKEK